MGRNVLRSENMTTGEINIRARRFPESRRRPGGVYFGLFIGQHQKGVWAMDRTEIEAAAAVYRASMRPCLCCRKPFQSQGNHNRLCNDCRLKSVGLI